MEFEVLGFLALSLVIAVTPGPSVIYVVSYSLRYGARAGLVSTLGINAGSIIFILIAAFGFSLLLDVFPDAIALLQLVGGFYLIYLAWQMWPKEQAIEAGLASATGESHKRIFANGFITSLLNPKDVLFYTAFIPAFIPAGAAGGARQRYFIGLAFSYMLIGFLSKCAFALCAGSAKSALNSKNASLLNYVASVVLAVLGVYVAGKTLYAQLV